MWVRLLNEQIRELSYTARLAGISLNVTWNGENMGFMFFSYNEGYQSFFEEALKELQTFVPTKELFESKKTAFVTGMKNSLLGEPFNRLDDLRSMCLGNMTLTVEDLI
jgi:secreted Zn-dependent insulinase-like peptidase